MMAQKRSKTTTRVKAAQKEVQRKFPSPAKSKSEALTLRDNPDGVLARVQGPMPLLTELFPGKKSVSTLGAFF